MRRLLALTTLLLGAAGCVTPAERLPLKPLPEDIEAVPYDDLLTRARLQATAATEAFYVDRWSQVEEAARNLEETARYLPRAVDVPVSRKERLPNLTEELTEEAKTLREAAKARDADKVNAALQRLNLKIRQLRGEG